MANRSRGSIRITKIGQSSGVVDPVKIILSSILITVQICYCFS